MQSSSLKSSTKRLSRAGAPGWKGKERSGWVGQARRFGGEGEVSGLLLISERASSGDMQEEAPVCSSAVILVWRGAVGVAPC